MLSISQMPLIPDGFFGMIIDSLNRLDKQKTNLNFKRY